MSRYITLLLFIGLAWGQSLDIENKIARYNPQDNSFIYNDSLQADLKVSEFISTLHDSSAILRGDIIKKVLYNINKYNKKNSEYSSLKKKYNSGTESENGLGRKVIENNYLIDDKELWYMAAVIVITLPAVPWLIERQKQQEIDRQMDSKSYYSGEGANPEQWEKGATIGIKSGIIIGIIGFLGSKIKAGQKEILIEHSRIKEPKLSDALSKEAITLLILAYNSLLNE
jgi:hypothetical protein